MSIAMLASGITSVVGGFIGAGQARRAQDRARKQLLREERAFNSLKRQRQGLNDLGAMARDRSGDITNPFANIGVATQAAEFQAEEADVALANTLDTLRATGAGAGGATALAQAALKSKRDIGASIEKQEIQAQQMRAQGQARAEVSRAQIGAQADALRIRGTSFTQQMREARQFRDEDRQAALLDQARAQFMQARQQKEQALGSAIGGLAGLVGGGLLASHGFKGSEFEKDGGNLFGYIAQQFGSGTGG